MPTTWSFDLRNLSTADFLLLSPLPSVDVDPIERQVFRSPLQIDPNASAFRKVDHVRVVVALGQQGLVVALGRQGLVKIGGEIGFIGRRISFRSALSSFVALRIELARSVVAICLISQRDKN